MKSIVSLSKCNDEDIKKAVFKAIELTDFRPKKINSVIIKPNMCYYWDATVGETTDPRVVSAIIDYVREFCNPDADIQIAEADASAMKTRHVFKMLRYTDLAANKEVELLNLCDDDFREIDVKTKNESLIIKLPKSIFECDLFINVPKLKVHRTPVITCAMKNLFGCIHEPVKAKYHSNLDEVIVGINQEIKPDLIVVDGVVALGQYPIRLGLVMAGMDSLAVDFTAARIMGYSPHSIKHLRLAEKKNIGNSDVRLVGEKIDNFKDTFPHVNNFILNATWDMQLRMIKIYTKITGDVVPPIMGDL